MVDVNVLAEEYTKAYLDKTRIYFIEKYLSTFNADAGKTTQFKLFPRQKAFLKSLAENARSIAIKHRQAGITTVSAAWVAAQMALADPSKPETVLCIGNKLDLSQQLITKIRDFLIQVPRWYWGDEFYSPDPKSKKNKVDIFVKNSKSELELFNGCRAVARSSGENAARGISAVSILIFDEAAFIENGPAVYASAVAAASSYGDKAKIIMVSTPNGKDELYYKTYRQALEKKNGYNPVEFRWFQDLRYNKFLKWYKKNEKTGELDWIEEETLDKSGTIVYDEEKWRKYEQQGWTPTSPWYQAMCASFNNDSMKIAQELDVSFLGSADNVVAPEFIEQQRKLNVREPLEEMKDPFVEETWFWKPPIEGHRYALGCDPSRGTAHDNTSIQVIDLDGRDENGMPIIEQVMEYNGKKLGDEIGNMCYRYATMYNNAYVIFDATGGQADAAILTMINMGYKNFYYEDNVQKTYMVQNQSKASGVKYNDILPGFHFQGNRFPVLSNFAGMVRNNEIKIRSLRTVNELDTWIFKGDTGRIDHMDGATDDNLCAIAMVLFVMQFSLNKLQAVKNKDAAILQAYMVSGGIKVGGQKMKEGGTISPNSPAPFYTSEQLTNKYGGRGNMGNYMWLFSKTY